MTQETPHCKGRDHWPQFVKVTPFYCENNEDRCGLMCKSEYPSRELKHPIGLNCANITAIDPFDDFCQVWFAGMSCCICIRESFDEIMARLNGDVHSTKRDRYEIPVPFGSLSDLDPDLVRAMNGIDENK